jgi:hypothetical protein
VVSEGVDVGQIHKSQYVDRAALRIGRGNEFGEVKSRITVLEFSLLIQDFPIEIRSSEVSLLANCGDVRRGLDDVSDEEEEEDEGGWKLKKIGHLAGRKNNDTKAEIELSPR